MKRKKRKGKQGSGRRKKTAKKGGNEKWNSGIKHSSNAVEEAGTENLSRLDAVTFKEVLTRVLLGGLLEVQINKKRISAAVNHRLLDANRVLLAEKKNPDSNREENGSANGSNLKKSEKKVLRSSNKRENRKNLYNSSKRINMSGSKRDGSKGLLPLAPSQLQ